MWPLCAPLHYRISDWRQLDKCLSNNSRDLRIATTVMLNNDKLNGLRISVIHEDLGNLFTCIVGGKGRLISEDDTGFIQEFTPAQILAELSKYGFNISYVPVEHLSGNQLEYLTTINKLGFDKIRILNVYDTPLGVKEFSTHVVVFNSKGLDDWMNAGYSPSIKDYHNAIDWGKCICLDDISKTKNFNWTFLHNAVMNISDILADNTQNLI